MAKGARYTPEFKAKAVRLLTESRGSYSSETKAIEQVAKDLGVAPETLRRWRNKTDATVAAETKQSAEDAMAELKSSRAEVARLRRANEILTTRRLFSRHARPGTARPDTALMVAYIDEFKDRFRVGPIRRVLAASLDCGFITPRGYRMFRSRPVSRMAARHEALARDILEIHADFFMAVYGYRKTRAQLLARGWDPAEIGRDQVMNVMRESGIRGVRRGRTPVTTKPAKGTGGRPDLVERRFEAEARTGCTWPTSSTCAWPTARSATRRSSPTCSPAGSSDGRAPPPWTPGSCRCRRWNRRYHGPPRMAARTVSCTIPTMARGTSARVHHQGRGVRHASLDRHGRRLVRQRHGRERRRRVQDRARLATQAFQDLRDLELATFRWVSWRGLEASAPVLGLQDTGTDRNRVLCKPSGASAPL